MRSSKLYLSLALLSIFVFCSLCAEEKAQKNDAVADVRKKVGVQGRNDRRHKGRYSDDDDDADDGSVGDIDDRIGLSSYADNRYSAFAAPESNYRTRSRWPAQSASSFLPSQTTFLEDSMDEPEWSRFDFPSSFPSSESSFSFDNKPILSSGPSCTSVVDAQYAIFSDVCGAVPQARYSLPNAFGHRERWQIAQVLGAVASSSSDVSCIRSLRLLLCPILFPPCQTRYEPPPVLPCQSFCRAVKSKCAAPALDLLPCEILPQSSDLCPTNQAYGSFASLGAFPSASSPPLVTDRYPSFNFPKSRSYPSLQSQQSAQPFGPLNFYNNGPFSSENLTPILTDFSPRISHKDYNRPNSRYSPLTRSSTESRPTTDLRPQIDTRFSTDAHTAPMSSFR